MHLANEICILHIQSQRFARRVLAGVKEPLARRCSLFLLHLFLFLFLALALVLRRWSRRGGLAGNEDDIVGTGTGNWVGHWNDFCRRGNPGNRLDPPLPALLPPIQLKDDCEDKDDAPDAGGSRIRDWDCALRRSRCGVITLFNALACGEGSTAVVGAVEGESAEKLGTIPGGTLFVLLLCVEEVSRRANPEISSSMGDPFEDLVARG